MKVFNIHSVIQSITDQQTMVTNPLTSASREYLQDLQDLHVLLVDDHALVCVGLALAIEGLGQGHPSLSLAGSETMAYGWHVLYSLVVLLMMACGRYLLLRRDVLAHARQLAVELVVYMAILSVLVAAYIGWLYVWLHGRDPIDGAYRGFIGRGGRQPGFSASDLPAFLAFSFPVIASVWLWS
jgi:hypothetical protein